MWAGFLTTIFSYEDHAEKKVLRDPAWRRCSEMFVASSRWWTSGLRVPVPSLSIRKNDGLRIGKRVHFWLFLCYPLAV